MNKALNVAVWFRMFRMKRRNSSYEPRLVSFPFIIVAILWIMLWTLWPHGERVISRRQLPVPPRVAFVRGVDSLYSRPFPFHTWKTVAGTGDGDAVVAAPWMITRPAKLLEKNAFTSDESSGTKMMFSDFASRDIKVYEPVWDDPAVFQNRTDDRMYLTIEPMGILKECGFVVPDFSSVLKKTDKPWFVTVFVEVDDKGKVEHVYLDTGSENKEINSIVVKSMYRGNLLHAGKRTEGHVAVNFGQN